MMKKFNSQVAHKYKILALTQKLDPSVFKEKPDSESGIVECPTSPPKLLYHVTHKKNLESIKKKGLLPKVGDVTKSAHGDKNHAATPLVYLLDTVATGILKTFGKDSIIITVDPNENDIWFFTGDELIEINNGNWGKIIDEGDFPIGIEAGDYYSELKVKPKDFYDYKGKKL